MEEATQVKGGCLISPTPMYVRRITQAVRRLLAPLRRRRWNQGSSEARQADLEQRIDMADSLMAELEETGLTILGWQVGANLQEVNFGFVADLDIEVYVLRKEREKAEEVVTHLARRWRHDGQKKAVSVILKTEPPRRLGSNVARGRDLVCGRFGPYLAF